MSATALVVSVARQLRIGLIAALLIVGVLLGPHSPHPLITSHVGDLQALGEVGVMLLLFLVGLDTHPQRLWSMRWFVAGFGFDLFLELLRHDLEHVVDLLYAGDIGNRFLCLSFRRS